MANRHVSQRSDFKDSCGNITWDTSNADSTNSGRDFLSLSSLEDIGVWVEHHVSFWLRSHQTNLTVRWFLWLKKEETKLPKDFIFAFHYLHVYIFPHHHYLQPSSMSSDIFRGRLQRLNIISRDFYLCYPVNSHKHISPPTTFIVNTPKPSRGGTRCTYSLTWYISVLLLSTWMALVTMRRKSPPSSLRIFLSTPSKLTFTCNVLVFLQWSIC